MKFPIDNVKAGMVLSCPIYGENGRTIILNSGAELTDKIINKLSDLDIKIVDIKLSPAQQFAYEADKGTNATIPSSIMKDAKESIKKFDTNKIIENSKLITSSILNSEELNYSLSEYKEISDVFSHSVRVSLFATLLAKYYNNTLDSFVEPNTLDKCKINLEHIATAAMLHDIGKLCKNEKLLNKVLSTGSNISKVFPAIAKKDLNNYKDEYSSIYSYLLLNNVKMIEPDVKMMILLSNELENGKGPLELPERYLNSRQSFVFGSKIIKLCSMYDEELNKMISQNESLENISSKLDYYAVNKIINNELEELFIEHVPLYSKGVKVKLSNDKYAIVEESFHGRMFISKPLVRTIPDNELIDLRTELSITIKEICKDEISFLEIVNKQINGMEEELSIMQKK